jgi:hypothetical protein
MRLEGDGMQSDRDGPLPDSPMKGEVKKGSGRCTIKPKTRCGTSPFMGEDGRSASRPLEVAS